MGSQPATFLPRSDLGRLFDALRADGRQVLGPTVRDGVVIYDEIDGPADLPTGRVSESGPGRYRAEQTDVERSFDYGVPVTSWKRFTHPPTVPLTRAHRTGPAISVEAVEPDVPDVAFVGARACELAALAIQSRVLRAGPAGDPDHAARDDAALIVAVECATATSTCFCTSVGSGPEVADGADLVLSELDDGFVVRPTSQSGARLVAGLGLAAATESDVAAAETQVAAVRAAMGAPLPLAGVADRLRGALDHPGWAAVAERCLSCANCTLVCPTCFCTSVAVASELDGVDSSTSREWDSCFNADFARIAGDVSFRPRTEDRYRQWLTHKFSTWWDQFGSSGCVGCGRCIAWCPVGIDVRDELMTIAPPTARPGPVPWPAAPAAGHAPAPLASVELARHVTTTIASNRPETTDTATLLLETTDRDLLAAEPGQFVMIERPGFAIPPISISRIRSDGLELTIRSAGPATDALVRLSPGDQVSLRGPFGRGWPIAEATGRDVVVVAGGIGLAPLRPVIDAIIRDRARLRMRTATDRLFLAEMARLAGRADLEVREIVDRGRPHWRGRIGLVTALIDEADWDGSRTSAFVCGPDRMMGATAAALARRGVPAASTWLTLERNMACGVGTCGHCQLGPFFVCRDGPVFSVAELGSAFSIEGL